MKIVFIFDKVMHYHINTFTELEKKLSELGHELILFSGSCKKIKKGRDGIDKKILKDEYKYEFIDYNLFSYKIIYQKYILNLIKAIKPDIVVVPGHVGNISNWFLFALKNINCFKLVTWYCGYEYHPNKIKFYINKYFLSMYDFHLAYHSNAKKYLLQHGVNEKKIKIFYNTIDEQKIIRLDQISAKINIIEQYALLDCHNIVLYVGAILKEKKLDLLIEAFNDLKVLNTYLFIVGDGEYKNELESRNTKKNIIFTGKIIHNVGIYFDAADIFVLPGTGGLAINEAMAHGLPIVSGYADGSADDLVINGVNGYRLNEYSKDELANIIDNLLRDKELRKTFSLNSLLLINGKFSFKNYLSRIIDGILSSIVN